MDATRISPPATCMTSGNPADDHETCPCTIQGLEDLIEKGHDGATLLRRRPEAKPDQRRAGTRVGRRPARAIEWPLTMSGLNLRGAS